MLAALPDGRSTASAPIEANSRRILPPTLSIPARSAAVGAWSYPTSRCSRDGADVAADAPATSANAPTASAARNAFKCLSPLKVTAGNRSTPLTGGPHCSRKKPIRIPAERRPSNQLAHGIQDFEQRPDRQLSEY